MRRLIAWALFAPLSLGLTLACGLPPIEAKQASERPRSYREIRFERVVGQTDWSTCGPAVLATYFTYYLGYAASEAEMIKLTSGDGPPDRDAAPGTSMLRLRDALVEMGLRALGYRVSLEELISYFDRGGPPLILHVTRPQPHYVLAVGNVGSAGGHLLFIADPSYGRRLVIPRELEAELGFAGYVLVPIPPEPQLQLVAAKQQEELALERLRLRRLEAVGQ